jgi:hypothetical protein
MSILSLLSSSVFTIKKCKVALFAVVFVFMTIVVLYPSLLSSSSTTFNEIQSKGTGAPLEVEDIAAT